MEFSALFQTPAITRLQVELVRISVLTSWDFPVSSIILLAVSLCPPVVGYLTFLTLQLRGFNYINISINHSNIDARHRDLEVVVATNCMTCSLRRMFLLDPIILTIPTNVFRVRRAGLPTSFTRSAHE